MIPAKKVLDDIRKISKKVLFIYPKTGFDPVKPRMPSSFIYLGTVLRKKGYDPVIVDTRVDQNYKEKIIEHLKDSIAVGITTMTGQQILFALGLAKFVRENNPNVKIIWGGVHPSLLPVQTIENPLVDILVRKEGENILPELIQAIEKNPKNPDYSLINGITFKDGSGKIISNPDAPLVDLKELSSPDWTLIDWQKYRIFDVQSGRGCPHQCTYCYNIMFNQRRWRPKPPEKVVAEIEEIITKYGVKEINFIDDNFLTDMERARKIMREFISRGLNFTWRTNCRVDYFDRFDLEFLRLAHRAGLRELQFGCESGSQRILDLIKKDISIEQIKKAVTMAKDAGIQAQCSFMIGFPWETKEDNKKTFDLIDKLRKMDPKILINMIAIYTPYPGSELFETAQQFGYCPPKSLERWGNYSYTYVNTPWIKGHKKWQYESISYISRFYFYDQELRKKFITPLLILPYLFLNLSAKIRWKTRFFSLPLEWVMLKRFLDFKKQRELDKTIRTI